MFCAYVAKKNGD